MKIINDINELVNFFESLNENDTCKHIHICNDMQHYTTTEKENVLNYKDLNTLIEVVKNFDFKFILNVEQKTIYTFAEIK